MQWCFFIKFFLIKPYLTRVIANSSDKTALTLRIGLINESNVLKFILKVSVKNKRKQKIGCDITKNYKLPSYSSSLQADIKPQNF